MPLAVRRASIRRVADPATAGALGIAPDSQNKRRRMLGLGANEPDLAGEERRWRREMRSAWLRGVVFLILVATLSVARQYDSLYAHTSLVVSYGVVTLLVLAHAYARRGPYWLSTAFVVVDAILVVVLFHEHLLASNTGFDHSLTAPALAVAFLLLTQVALRLEPKLVLLFSGLVILGWFSLLAATIAGHSHADLVLDSDWPVFWTEGALASFCLERQEGHGLS